MEPPLSVGAPSAHRGALRRAVLPAALLAAGGIGLWTLGGYDAIRLDSLVRLRDWIDGWGAWGPLVFVAGYVLLELVFFPALPLTLLGGLAFGPVLGTVYVSVAATVAAALAFLVARHAARGLVEGWVAGSPRLRAIDRAVAVHGWRILMITRLVPLFPYNLQNYAYGLTPMRFWPYVGITWACMLPATVAYTLAGGALSGGPDLRRAVTSLGVAAALLVLLSFLPGWLTRRSRAAGELLGGKP
jgi:uncharacterized membrane protein YdjX (TVP38/TMEM64 family)